MRYILGTIFVFLSIACKADVGSDEIHSKVESIAKLYGDGYASLVESTIHRKDVADPKTGYCVTLVSFYMEGFSGGNNSSQFLVFLNCRSKSGDYDSSSKFVNSVTGIHPFYDHKNTYDINSAKYVGKSISIDSPSGPAYFSKKHSIWWSGSEQDGI